MRLIHCGDLHLGSPMGKNLTLQQANERRNEMLLTLERMISFAKAEQVRAILIAGDLFDSKQAGERLSRHVLQLMENAPEIDFYYLRGNHDTDCMTQDPASLPDNLKLFSNKWKSYRYDTLTISGVEFDGTNGRSIYDTMNLDEKRINIVLLHGQESSSIGKEDAELIDLKELKDRGIDYLALGHVHSYQAYPLDSRGVYCYSGCLEGRGFDECGKKGFVVLETMGRTITHQWIPFSTRECWDLEVDITDTMDTYEADSRIQTELMGQSDRSMIKVRLTGEVSGESVRNLGYLEKKYKDQFFAFKIQDDTRLKINLESYKRDASLKGEFIRLVMEQELNEGEQKRIIETGLKALRGEEIV
ncbi:MAG: DNA repair exonuclease [Lachnospiraceae bacterium]